MLLSPPILPFLRSPLINDMHAYFSYCSISAVSPDSNTFHGKMHEHYNGATGDRRENFTRGGICLHNRSPSVRFGAFLAARALQNCFQCTQ